jgi:hypothetical protein
MDLVASFAHIGQKGTKFGSPCGNLGWPKSFACHNQIRGPSLGLKRALVGDTFYYITTYPTKSTKKKKNKCMSIHGQPRF